MRSLRRFAGEGFSLLFWAALVSCGIECSRGEVRRRSYQRPLDLPETDAIKPSAALETAAKDEFATAEARRRLIDDKKLTLATPLLATTSHNSTTA